MKISFATLLLALHSVPVVTFQGPPSITVQTFSTAPILHAAPNRLVPDNNIRRHDINKLELNSGSSDTDQKETGFTKESLDFTMGYLNKHHRDILTNFAIAFTPLGVIQKQKNALSGGSYSIEDATIVGIHKNYVELDVKVQIRNEKEPRIERQTVSLDAEPQTFAFVNLPKIPAMQATNQIDDFIRRMNRLCLICKSPSTTGKLIQLGFQIGGDKSALLKEDLYLNQVPHNRYVRQYFYDMASKAVLAAVIACSKGDISNRMQMTTMFPEMNPGMDSYRIGTLLELARSIAITLAEQNLRVRICVQGMMGVGIFTGIPKQLSGVSILLERMDWQSVAGEENEGMVGNYINFGEIGKEHVVNSGLDREGNEIFQDDVFLLLCPQSMIGTETSIIGALDEMVEAAGDRPVILINPDLTDKVSSQGQQNIRGRKDRIEFADSFKTIYHFRNIYVSGTSYFPILGAVNKPGHEMPWVAYQRRDWANDGGEIYVPALSTEEEPEGYLILETFD
jgi:adenylate kinase